MEEPQKMFVVDQLKAMEWCKSAWEEISPEAIANCFGHTNLVNVGRKDREANINESIDEEMCRMMQLLAISPGALSEAGSEIIDVHEATLDSMLITSTSEVLIKAEKKCLKNQTLLTKFFK